MSSPVDPTAEPDPADEVLARLAAGDGGSLARAIGWLRRAIRVVAALAAATGVLALVLGLAAWGGSIVGAVVVLAICAPAVVAPLYVARRTGALAAAASHPREVAEEARDLVTRVRSSAELATLARTLRTRELPTRRGRPGGRRLGRGLGVLRLASTVVGQARPDPERHPLLVPFLPERLRATWLAVVVSLWAWLATSVLALVAAVVLLARAL
ncbi:MAG: hypothetical protein R2746_15620 [Acidimicrobiales bacterium]